MKGFRFKLQPVLKVKELEENLLLEEYILLKKNHAEVLEKLNRLKEEKEDHLNQIQSLEEKGELDVNRALLARNYLIYLRHTIELLTEEEFKRRAEMMEGFNRFVEKTKERKILEKLKEKHKEAFIAEQLLKMQNELDDLAQGRFNHQKSKNLEAER